MLFFEAYERAMEGAQWSNAGRFSWAVLRCFHVLQLFYLAVFIWQSDDRKLHFLPVVVLSWTRLVCGWQRLLTIFGTDSLTCQSPCISCLFGLNQISFSKQNFLSPISSEARGPEVGERLSLCGLLWGSALLASSVFLAYDFLIIWL